MNPADLKSGDVHDGRVVIVPGMCYYIPLTELRRTPKVDFHSIPVLNEEGIGNIQRVVHQPGAQSPSVLGMEDMQPWYMHPHQEDNCLMLGGERVVDLYTKEHGKKTFLASMERLAWEDGTVITDEPYMLGWYKNVFHRPNSPEGSIAIFFVMHTDGFDLNSEFNIYTLNEETGEYDVLREGYKDQPSRDISE